MTRRARSLACLLLAFLAVAAAAQETPDGFEIERFSWVGAVEDGGGVTVVNRFGDVRARFGGYEGRVEAFANVQHFAGEGPRLEVATKESAAGVEVTVGYRDERGELVTARDPRLKKRADLVVWVPKGAPLTATADGGVMDLRSLESDVRARTTSGAVTALKLGGDVDLASESGDLLALLQDWSTARRYVFASDRGDVTLYCGGEVNAALRVATGGLISTDFSMTVDFQAGRRPVRRGEALAGKGSSAVEIESASGHVRLVRRPLARDARVRPEAER
jgi:hypothetical protein